MKYLTRNRLFVAVPAAFALLAACGENTNDAQAEATPPTVTIGPEGVALVE